MTSMAAVITAVTTALSAAFAASAASPDVVFAKGLQRLRKAR